MFSISKQIGNLLTRAQHITQCRGEIYFFCSLVLMVSFFHSPLVAYGQTQPYQPTADHPVPAWFVDVAAKAGILVRNVNGSPKSKRYILEATGSGVAILDYDRDGWQDIFLVNGSTLDAITSKSKPTSHLFHNNRDGTFTDVTARAGISFSGWGQGACVGDYDNDGYDDVYITAYGKNHLFHNRGNGTFKDVSEQSGVSGTGKEWGTGCAFVDYDRDGRLDLIVANYVHFDLAMIPKPGSGPGCMWKGVPVMCGPRGLPYAPNTLFHNLGSSRAGEPLRFEEVSKPSGIERTNGHYCFSVTTLDYNEDGWPDIYIACDSTPSILYRNNHDGTFTDVATNVGVAFNEDGREQAGMGSASADYDRDGHLDLFKTNFSDDTSTLYRSQGDGTFTDDTHTAGLAINTDALGWGTMFADVDNDGWPDLLVANGHVYPEVDSARLGSLFREPRFLYYNLGRTSSGLVKFKDISKTSGPALLKPLSGRGLATADLFNDGRIEAVVNNLSDDPMLLVNLARNRNHWLDVHLIGTISNRDAIGARVTLRSGTRVWVDEVRSGSSYNSSSDLRVHFGLGLDTHLDSIKVLWPNGFTEVFDPPPAPDHVLEIVEGKGRSFSNRQ
jgi:YHS domain-containing protein